MPNHEPPPLDVADALAQATAFQSLDSATRAELASHFQLQPARAGDMLAAAGQLGTRLWLVLDGTAGLQPPEGAGRVRLQRGALFGHGALPRSDAPRWSAHAETDCTLAWLAPADVAALCSAHPVVGCHLAPGAAPETDTPRSNDVQLNLMTTPVHALLKREPITVPPTMSIRDAAQLMRERRVSSVLIVERDHLFGLVTDRDLRNRALAAGLDTARPVHEIATIAPLTIELHSPAFDALLLMARHNIHHVPVMDGQRVAGMITATDLTEQHSSSAVFLVGDVYRQTDVDGLARVATRVKQLQQNLAAAGASAYSSGHVITAVTDALTCRLLQLGEAQFGPAPVDYAWVAAGSQARNEQSAKTDQDNCMILDDRYDEALHGSYFKSLTTYVCDGLDACGYVHCPGEMMAMTDQWRQPKQRWAQYFRRWTQEPEPKALMLTCVFFDMRCIAGRTELMDDLRREVLAHTRGNGIFLAYMVGNALTHRPPLGLFGGLSVARSGEHRGRLDLKHNGIVPIVDLARVYALAGGHDAVNTHDRLLVAAQSGEISERGAHDLRDALEFLAALRIRHQARQTARGEPADNFLGLDELSNFERSQLKDAFAVVQTLQGVLAQRYQGGRL